ncbi:MAG TPA: phospholipid carrier-dependent glycosyltransferase [Thermoanaerobaculia bacterium]|nr:phospholipid carrier-dependent glycosyltransferase [Thermoanaerobaculia bacterium]
MTISIPHFDKRLARPLIGVLLVLVALMRIVSTYGVFSQTMDEPSKLSSGMHQLVYGHFPRTHDHPPLGLITLGIGPRLAGIPYEATANRWDDGNRVLYHEGTYRRNLALARMGVLPFVIATAVLTFLWAHRLFGIAVALVSLLLLTSLPEFLAHGGIASNDMAIAATLMAALYCFTLWLERPSFPRSIALGISLGLALAAKFSALVFFPAAAAVIAGWRFWFLRRRDGDSQSEPGTRTTPRVWLGAAVTIVVVAWLTVWGSYGFATGGVTAEEIRVELNLDDHLGAGGRASRVAYAIARRTPAIEYLVDLAKAVRHQTDGHTSYLFGEVTPRGLWYYLPVAFIFKTPIAFTILGLTSVPIALSEAARKRSWGIPVPLLAAAAIAISCMFSNIAVGLRYILPIYPLLAISAGFAAVHLWTAGWTAGGRFRRATRPIVVSLLVWHLAASALAHPDYLAYFNELARRPDRIIVDSNLDWGQDLLRLEKELRRRGVESFSIAYFGSCQLERHDLPPFTRLEPGDRATGWIAISVSLLRGMGPGPAAYAWLRELTPVGEVGHSIRLYYVPQER